MNWVKGFPATVCVGQTQINDLAALPSQQAELDGFNLALHVGDDPKRVQQHRISLLKSLAPYGAKRLVWMEQVHSTTVLSSGVEVIASAQQGDALVTQEAGQALMMMTADCLAIVLCDADGTEVANLHAGWRGLAHGMIEKTVSAMQHQPYYAWMGVAISQTHFEIGAEVKDTFCQHYAGIESYFKAGQPNKFYADLYGIARFVLKQCGVQEIWGGEQCSFADPNYFSYRREAKTGRMATFVFIR